MKILFILIIVLTMLSAEEIEKNIWQMILGEGYHEDSSRWETGIQGEAFAEDTVTVVDYYYSDNDTLAVKSHIVYVPCIIVEYRGQKFKVSLQLIEKDSDEKK